MAKPKLTNDDFCRTAKRLRCEVAAIKAVAEVESRGEGFYSNGFPTILFERHVFRKYTNGIYSKDHPELSGPQGNYGAAGANQRRKFQAAYALNPTAAIKACSWGKFQVMGFNYRAAGFDSVQKFYEAMQESEGQHLFAFIGFVISNRLDDEIRHKDWAGFAYGYNGAGYKKNNYDTAMARAYNKFVKENINCDSAASTTSLDTTVDQSSAQTSNNPSEVPPKTEGTVETTVIGGQAVVEKTTDTPGTATVETQSDYQGVGLIAVLKKDFTAAGLGNLSFQSLQAYAEQASGWPPWVISLITKIATLAIVLGIAWLLFRFIHYGIFKLGGFWREHTQATINADPTMKDVQFK